MGGDYRSDGGGEGGEGESILLGWVGGGDYIGDRGGDGGEGESNTLGQDGDGSSKTIRVRNTGRY